MPIFFGMSQTFKDIPKSARERIEINLEDKKVHQISVKLTTEEYGWLVRYCDKHDVSMASIVRKGFRMYRAAVTKNNKTTDKQQ